MRRKSGSRTARMSGVPTLIELAASFFIAPLNHAISRVDDTATTASSMLLRRVSSCRRLLSRRRKLASSCRAVLSKAVASRAISSFPDSGKRADRFPAPISWAKVTIFRNRRLTLSAPISAITNPTSKAIPDARNNCLRARRTSARIAERG